MGVEAGAVTASVDQLRFEWCCQPNGKWRWLRPRPLRLELNAKGAPPGAAGFGEPPTGVSSSSGRATVIATFHNSGAPEKIVFDFQNVSGRWLLDDAHSVEGEEKWTFSKLLRCES